MEGIFFAFTIKRGQNRNDHKAQSFLQSTQNLANFAKILDDFAVKFPVQVVAKKKPLFRKAIYLWRPT